jgi:hypothetical protein
LNFKAVRLSANINTYCRGIKRRNQQAFRYERKERGE